MFSKPLLGQDKEKIHLIIELIQECSTYGAVVFVFQENRFWKLKSRFLKLVVVCMALEKIVEDQYVSSMFKTDCMNLHSSHYHVTAVGPNFTEFSTALPHTQGMF